MRKTNSFPFFGVFTFLLSLVLTIVFFLTCIISKYNCSIEDALYAYVNTPTLFLVTPFFSSFIWIPTYLIFNNLHEGEYQEYYSGHNHNHNHDYCHNHNHNNAPQPEIQQIQYLKKQNDLMLESLVSKNINTPGPITVATENTLKNKQNMNNNTDIVSDIKNLIKEHRKPIYWVLLALIIDFVFLKGQFTDKIKGIIEALLERAQSAISGKSNEVKRDSENK